MVKLCPNPQQSDPPVDPLAQRYPPGPQEGDCALVAAPKSADVTPFWPPRSGCVRSSAPRCRWASGWALHWA